MFIYRLAALNSSGFEPSKSALLPQTVTDIIQAMLGEPDWVVLRTLKDAEQIQLGRIDTKYDPATVTPPQDGDLTNLQDLSSAQRAELRSIAHAAIERGEVAMLVIAAGMATGFGRVAKAAVEVKPGKTFLDYNLADIVAAQRKYNSQVPVVLFQSDETGPPIQQIVAERGYGDSLDITTVRQPSSVYLQLVAGKVVLGKDNAGQPIKVMGGHYDIFPATRDSGAIAALKAKGVRYIMSRNTDNLAATLSEDGDLEVIGYHIQRSLAAKSAVAAPYQLTVETAKKWPKDKGGVLARIAGVLRLLEGPRVHPHIEAQVNGPDTYPSFNTNTLVADIEVYEQPVDLSYMLSSKNHTDGSGPFLLVERLCGEMLGEVSGGGVISNRSERFNPCKFLYDLWLFRSDWAEALGAKLIPAQASSGDRLRKPAMAVSSAFLAHTRDFSRIAGDGIGISMKALRSLFIGGNVADPDKEKKTFNAAGSNLTIGANVTFAGDVKIVFDDPHATLHIADGTVLKNITVRVAGSDSLTRALEQATKIRADWGSMSPRDQHQFIIDCPDFYLVSELLLRNETALDVLRQIVTERYHDRNPYGMDLGAIVIQALDQKGIDSLARLAHGLFVTPG